MGIYDREHKILFSGDHILNKITPNISFWEFKYEDILGIYLKNLDKVYNMEVDIIYAAHRGVIKNPKLRIEELQKHYADRNAEVYSLLKEGEKFSAAQIAAKMHWDYRAKNFEEFIKFSLHFIDTSKLRKVCLYTDFFRYYTKMSEAERGESYVGKGVDSGGKSAYRAGR